MKVSCFVLPQLLPACPNEIELYTAHPNMILWVWLRNHFGQVYYQALSTDNSGRLVLDTSLFPSALFGAGRVLEVRLSLANENFPIQPTHYFVSDNEQYRNMLLYFQPFYSII